MKIRIDIDCSPQEARAFFGLPDLQPLQEAVMAEFRDKFVKAAGDFDAETIVGQWMQGGGQALETMQKMFWPGGAGGKGGGAKGT